MARRVDIKVFPKWRFEDLSLVESAIERQFEGTVLHTALSMVESQGDAVDTGLLVRRALSLLGERHDEEMVKRLSGMLGRIFELPEAALFFGKGAKVYREVEVVLEGGREVVRPDRVVVLPDKAVVVDFKIRKPESPQIIEKYREQVSGYIRAVSEALGMTAEGYLLFIETPEVMKV